jgi:phage tail sheath gpL-like
MAFSFSTSYAAGKFTSMKNAIFASSANVLAHKILIVATYDPLKTSVVDEVPVLVTSPEDTASKFGDGFMAHRLHAFSDAGAQGITTYIMPQAEAGGATAATGTITFTTTTTVAGTMHLYVGGDYIPFQVAAADDAEAIATACVAAITAATEAPVTAANTLGVVTLTSKTKGTYGNDIDVSFDLGFGQISNVEITAVIVDMATGSGDPDITDALNALGTGDNQNEDWYTELVHGYGYNKTAVQDVISAYNGTGNGFNGNYAKEAGRPFRTLTGDVAPGSSGLSDVIAKGNAGRELDRTNGIISVPGSQSHPSEIAALALGNMARINNVRAGENYVDEPLVGIWPGSKSSTVRWTSDYDNRDLATKSGVSPTLVVNGVVYMQDVVTFYHPASLPIGNNGWLSQRNISLTMNIMNVKKQRYATERYKGNTIVADKTKVTSAVDRAKVVDIDTIIEEELLLATQFEGNSWLHSADYTKEALNGTPGVVTLRGDARGFLVQAPYIYSGESAILDNETQFDVSIAILQ